MLRQKIEIVPMAIGPVLSWSAVQAQRPVLSVSDILGAMDLPSTDSPPVGSPAAMTPNKVRDAATVHISLRDDGAFPNSLFQDFFPDRADDSLNRLFEQQFFDRNFDARFHVLDETSAGIDLAIGVSDFLGSENYSFECSPDFYCHELNIKVCVGDHFTLIDVSFDDFGECSFDKVIENEFPLSWFADKPSRWTAKETIRPNLRDGGERLHADRDLYPLNRDNGGPELSDSWRPYLQ